jgi:carbonic anhydrase/acetyltransferase-like protein (isoleucine patch superfamily)
LAYTVRKEGPKITLVEFGGIKPEISSDAYVSPRATLIGEVEVGEGSSIWENAVLRGDMGLIKVGKRSNIQDNCTLHSDTRGQCLIGDFVTVGHNSVVHGSIVHDYVLVGMNSTLLEGAEVGPNSIVAAGSVVLEGQKTPPAVLLAGVPAKPVRSLDDSDLAAIRHAAQAYTELIKLYKEKA